ncbi:MAG: hypothetical protein FWG57_03655 [Endomicrobia bacterium]|nr:hypothetical protein [Endomicrobiia bacterium]
MCVEETKNNENEELLKEKIAILELQAQKERLREEINTGSSIKKEDTKGMSARRGTALVLTFFFAGLGHIFIGDIGRGIGFATVSTIWLFVAVATGIGIVVLIIWVIYALFDVNKRAKQLGY